MAGVEVNMATKFVTITCCHDRCGITFAVERSWYNYRHDDHRWFYCPNGHRQHYPQKSDQEKAEEEAARARADRDRYARMLNNESERRRATERSRSAIRGQLTKTKNRIARGLCPCCNREFMNLARHMERQHPDYSPEATEGATPGHDR